MLPETNNLTANSTPNGNGHHPGGLPFALAPSRPPTLTELVCTLDDCASALYDALAELEDALGRVETGSAELRRRRRVKRARDARFRARKRGGVAA